MDEVEAVGAETSGDLEETVRFHIHSNNLWKYDPTTHNPRVFGGVNTVFLGDFLATTTNRPDSFDVKPIRAKSYGECESQTNYEHVLGPWHQLLLAAMAQ